MSVVADVTTTVNMLPRTTSELDTIAIKLKRRSHYEHAFLTSTVRPDCVRQVGQYLVQNGELFKKEKISFNPQSLNLLQCEVQTPELQSSSVDTQLCPPNPHSNIPDNTDSWNEVEDNETERAGIYDTLHPIL